MVHYTAPRYLAIARLGPFRVGQQLVDGPFLIRFATHDESHGACEFFEWPFPQFVPAVVDGT
jgi:hypothetical protein